MSFDFSKLEQLRDNDKVTAKETFSEPVKEKTSLADVKLSNEQEERKRMQDVYRVYQENIRKSQELRASILKGIVTEDINTLFLQACECITCMTNDKVFIATARKKINERTN